MRFVSEGLMDFAEVIFDETTSWRQKQGKGEVLKRLHHGCVMELLMYADWTTGRLDRGVQNLKRETRASV
jgi:hypothetical protein